MMHTAIDFMASMRQCGARHVCAVCVWPFPFELLNGKMRRKCNDDDDDILVRPDNSRLCQGSVYLLHIWLSHGTYGNDVSHHRSKPMITTKQENDKKYHLRKACMPHYVTVQDRLSVLYVLRAWSCVRMHLAFGRWPFTGRHLHHLFL